MILSLLSSFTFTSQLNSQLEPMLYNVQQFNSQLEPMLYNVQQFNPGKGTIVQQSNPGKGNNIKTITSRQGRQYHDSLSPFFFHVYFPILFTT